MAALLLVATWLLYRRGRSWRDVGLRRPPLWRAIIVMPAALIFGAGLLAIVKTALTRAGYPGADYAIFSPIRGNLGEYLFWLLPVTVGSAAFGEEMIFRGFILDGFDRILGRSRLATAMAIALQAVVFSLLHAYQGVGGVITTLIVGLLLGLVWLATRRNLWAGIVMHALLDGSAMTAIFLGLPI